MAARTSSARPRAEEACRSPPLPREEVDVEDGLLAILQGDELGLRQVAARGDGDAVGATLHLEGERALGIRARLHLRLGNEQRGRDGLSAPGTAHLPRERRRLTLALRG